MRNTSAQYFVAEKRTETGATNEREATRDAEWYRKQVPYPMRLVPKHSNKIRKILQENLYTCLKKYVFNFDSKTVTFGLD